MAAGEGLADLYAALQPHVDAAAGERSPMVFLGREFFTASGIWEVARAQAAGADPPYDELLTLTDEPAEAVEFIRSRRR